MKGKRLIVIMAIIVLMFTIQASTALEIDDNLNLTQTDDVDIEITDNIQEDISSDDTIVNDTNLSDVVSVSSKEVLGASNQAQDVLGAEKHVSVNTLNELILYLKSGNVQNGDIIFLDGKTFGGYSDQGLIQFSKSITIYGGSSITDTARATFDLSQYNKDAMFQIIRNGLSINGIEFCNFKRNVANMNFMMIGTSSSKISDFTLNNCLFRNMSIGVPTSESNLIRLILNGNNCKIKNCEFINNTAGNLVVVNPLVGTRTVVSFSAENNTFINNTALKHSSDSRVGLGLCFKVWDDVQNAVFKNNIFINNTNAVHGAVYCILGKDTTIINDYLEGNGAVYGSGIEAHNGYVKVYNSTFINNYAEGTHPYQYSRSGSGAGIAFVGPNNYVENCTFISNSAETYAGAIDIIGDNTTIIDSRFYNNTAQKYAGAVHIEGENAVIETSVLENNNATSGGAVQIEGNHSKISKSNFTDNYAIQGAACYIEGYNATIEYSRFIDNNATHNLGSNVPDNSSMITSGGAVFIKGNNANIIYDTFEDNCADGNYANHDGLGGAVYIEGGNVNFHNDNFTNNYADLGGAVYIYGNDIASKNLLFVDNRAIAGGAVYIKGNDVTINSSDYHDNVAIQGGAIHIDGNDVEIINSNFNDNNATRSVNVDKTGADALDSMGGAIHIDGCNVEVHDNNITENTAIGTYINGGLGGALSIIGNNTVIYDNNITLNDAIRGGAIYVHGVNTTIKNMDFITNLAIHGGAIYVQGKQANITNNTFFDNNATHSLTFTLTEDLNKLPTSGGAIYIEGTESSITDNNFTYNAAIGINPEGGHGGAIYIEGYLTNITHNLFTKNEAIMGGAVYISGINATIDDTNFTYNNAIRGGAIFVQGVNATLTNLDFEYNNATHNLTYPLTDEFDKLTAIGGAVSIEGNGTYLENIDFYNNTALGVNKNGGLGGAVAVNGYDTTVKNVEFIDNQAIIGGAVYINGTLNTLNYTNFTNNAAIRGGAVYNHASNTTIIGSSYKNNSATHNLRFKVSDVLYNLTTIGGAVSIEGATVNVTECEFFNNTAVGLFENGGLGGAIAVNGSDNYIANSTFKDNEAIKGGAFYLEGDKTTIIDSNFSDNNAIKGGAGYIDGENSVIQNSNFTDNDARHDLRFDLSDVLKATPTAGGAIFITGDNVNVTSSIFTDNDAKATNEKTSLGGGAFYIEGNNANISDSYFENNTALKGGAVFITGNGTNIYDSNFTKNSVTNFTNMEGFGGAVYLENSHDSDFTRCKFTENTASINGGAIDWHEGATDGQIVECLFENNTAGANAGAVFWFGQGGIIKGSNFTNNKANGTVACVMGNSGDGGAIMWTGSDGTVDDCNFINNTAKDHGGAVYLRGIPGRADCDNNTFKNSHFENNTAGTNGGAVNWFKYATNGTIENSTFVNNTANRAAGAVFWNGETGTIKGSNFTNNRATGLNLTAAGKGGDGGAIVWIGSDGLVDDCRFINNTAPRTGGAVYLEASDFGECDNTTFSNSYFENNTAIDGGAIFWNQGATNGAIINSTFENNSAKANGGAVVWWGDNGTIEGSNFTNNRALGEAEDFLGYSGFGGAVIWSGSNGLADDCRFINNSATTHGGAVYLSNVTNNHCDNTTFSNSYFENNTAGINGGAIDWHEGATNGAILNSSFVNNSAKANGGAVFWFGTNGTINGSNFTGNDALGEKTSTYGRSGDGGAVIWTGSNGLVDDCRFLNNTAKNKGGAVYLDDIKEGGCDNTTFSNSYFENNVADINGGAIMWNKGATNGTIENSTFVNNTAHRAGGAVFWNGETGTIKGSNFTNNTATGLNLTDAGKGGDGGAIIWIGSDGLVDDCNFDNNTAAKCGGAVYLEASDLGECDNTTFSNSHFNNNTAGTNGGAIFWNDGATNGKILNSTFDNNCANRSAGAVYWYGTNGTIDNSNFTNNHALGPRNASDLSSGVGGAVFWTGSDGLVNNSRFINNTANNHGGAVYLEGTASENCDNTTFENSYFENNHANVNGGAVDWHDGATNGNIINSTFINNTAEANAGAVFWFGTNGTIKDSNFTNNRANGTTTSNLGYSGDGGAVMWTGSKGLVDNTTFVNNTAAKDGGAVYLRKLTDGACENTTFSNSKFINNTAANEGGAIDWNEGAIKGTIENSTFVNNSATDGGAVSWSGHNGVIVNSNFTNNSASEDGGAVRWTGIDGKIDNSRFISNNAAYGGAVYLRNCSHREDTNVTICDSYFENNTASEDGGAINWHLGTNATVDNSTFINNTANRGGAVFVNGTDGKIKDSNFTSNEAILGGAIYLNNENINVTDSNFTKNAAIQGGAVYVDAENNRISNSEFVNNTATYNLRVTTDSNLKTKGGAIYINSENTVIENSKFTNNTALTNREYNGKGNDIAASDDGFGGAVYVGADNANITSSDFNDNKACNGSAIYNDASNTLLDNDTFIKNQAWSYILNATVVPNSTYLSGTVTVSVLNYTGGDNIINAVYNAQNIDDIVFNEVTYIVNNDESQTRKTKANVSPVLGVENSNGGTELYQDSLERYQIITVEFISKETGEVVATQTVNTDLYGNYSFDISSLPVGNYTVKAYHPEDRNYKYIETESDLEILPYVDLNITKTVNSYYIINGDIVTFTITVSNPNNASVAHDVKVKDVLPANGNGFTLTHVSYSKGISFDSETDIWDIGDIENGTSVTLTLSFRVSINGKYNNTVKVSCKEDEWNYSNNNASVFFEVIPFNLTIVKQANITTVGNNTLVNFTIEVTNNAVINATNLVLTDILPDEFVYISSTYGGTNTTLRDIQWNINNLTAGETIKINVIAKSVKTGNATNNVSVYCSENTTVVKANATVNVVPVNLTVNKTANVTVVGNNTLVKFTIIVNNNSRVNATGVIVRDVLPSEFTFISASEGCGYVDGAYQWTITKLEKSTELWIIAKSNSIGNVTNKVNVTCHENNTNVSDNVSVNIVPVNLTVNKTANITKVGNNTLVNFTIVVNNTSIVNATNVNVTDILPDGFEFVTAFGGYTKNGQVINWILTNITAGNVTELWIVAKSNATGPWMNKVNVTSSENKTVVTDNVTVDVVPIAIEVNKTANVTNVGNNTLVNFTITVNNTSLINVTYVNVRDILPNGFVFVNATKGYSRNGQTVTWTLTNITAGNVAELWIVARSNATGPWMNNVNVTCKENSTVKKANVTVNVIPVNITVNKTANVTLVGNNTLINFTITVNNTSIVNATNVTVKDVLPTGLTFVDATEGWKLVDGAYTWNITKLENIAKFWIVARTSSIGNLTNWVNVTCTENSTIKRANETIDVRPVNLTINKTALVNGNISVGEEVTFKINITNNAKVNATTVTVTDIVPSGFTYVESNDTAYNNQTGILTIDVLKPGASYIFTVTLKAITNGTLTNYVNVTSNENDTLIKSNASVNVTPVVILIVNKTADYEDYIVGDTVIFTINITNKGPSNATNIKVKDILPTEGLEWISGDLEQTIDFLEAGHSTTVTITAKVLRLGVWMNKVNVTCDQNDTIKTDNVTVNVYTVDLRINKTANVTSVPVNGLINFTITVKNHSPNVATNVNITDYVNSVFTIIDTNGTNVTSGNNITWKVGTLNSDQSYSIWLVVKANTNGTFTNTAYTNCTEEGELQHHTETVKVTPVVSLKVNKTSELEGKNVTVSNLVQFTINVTNTGISNATGVEITDVVPTGFEFVSSNATGYNNKTGKLTVDLIKPGESYIFTITLRVIADGDLTNIVNATCNENKSYVRDEVSIKALPVILTVNKTVDINIVGNNTVVNFTITVNNTGKTNATNVKIIDELPDGLTFVNATKGYNLTEGKYVGWNITKLNNGTSIKYWITARSNAVGNWTNYVRVSCDENETVVEDNASVKVVPIKLTIIKEANLTNMGNNTLINFTITVNNTGDINATNVTVRDILPDVFEFVNATKGYNNTGQLVNWTISKLDVGAVTKFWIVAKSNAIGPWMNTVNITCSENKTNVSSSVTGNVLPVNITVIKEANLTLIANNTLVNFTITVKNVGKINATDVYVKDIVPNGFTVVSASTGNSTNGQTVNWTVTKLNVDETVKFWIVVRSNAVGNLTNWVNVTSNENKTVVTNKSTVDVRPVIITVNKTANVTMVGNNTLVNFTITVNNTGAVNATNVTVKDVLPTGLTFVNASSGYKQDGQNIEWNIFKLVNGAEFWIVARTNSVGDWDNVVTATSKENSTIVRANKTINVKQINGTVVKKANLTLIGNNTVVNFTIVVNHTSLVNATNVTVRDILPDGFVFVNATPGYNRTGQTVEWYFDILKPGQIENLWITARSNATGKWNNTVNVTCKENSTLLKANASVEVVDIELTINKTANITVTANNTVVNFTITVKNPSRVNATNVTVRDVLPNGLVFVNATAGWKLVDGAYQWNVSDFTNNSEMKFWITARTNATGILTNRVNVTCDENKTTVENHTTVDVRPIVLKVNKTANVTVIGNNTLVKFTIKVNNTASVNATNVTVRDIVPNGFTIVSASAGNTTKGQEVSWTIDMKAGNVTELWIIAKSNATGLWNNTVNVTCSENKTNVNSSATVEVKPVNLTVVKEANLTVMGNNTLVNFTITVKNVGKINATVVSVKDVLPNGFVVVDASAGKTIDGQVVYWTVAQLNAGNETKFWIVARSNATGNWTNWVNVTSNENSTVVKANKTVNVLPVNITVVKEANLTVMGNNTLVNFTITVKNVGKINATVVSVKDVLPNGFVVVDASAGKTIDGQVVYWTVAQLNAGNETKFWIVARSNSTGNWTNWVNVTSNENKTVVTNKSTVDVRPVIITVNKTANVIMVGNNTLVNFTITVNNTGAVNATNVTVKDVLPTGLTFVNASSGYKQDGQNIEWNISKLVNGAEFWIVARTNSVGDWDNVVTATSKENSTIVRANKTINVEQVKANLTKNANLTLIGNNTVVNFTIIVNHTSLVNATNVTVRDVLPDGFVFVNASEGFNRTGKTVEWYFDVLVPGQIENLWITARSNATGKWNNTVTASCNENSTILGANATVDVVPVNATITKKANVTLIGNNTLVNFTIVVNNTSLVNATNVTVKDVLPEGFEFVNATEGYNRTDQEISWYVGDLQKGQLVSYWIVAKSIAVGNWTNYVNATCNENSTIIGANESVNVVPVNFTVIKTSDKDSYQLYELINYTIKVTNTARVNATDITVVDIIDLTKFEIISSNVTYVQDGNKFTWNIDSLNVDESVSIRIVVKSLTNGTFTNYVNVTAKENNTVVTNKTSINVTPIVNLVVNKTVDVNKTGLNNIVYFWINVTNNGPSYATNIHVKDILKSDEFEFMDSNSAYDFQTGEFIIPSIAPNSSFIFYIEVKVLKLGNLTNTVSVNCSENETVKTANATVEVVPVELKVTKTANVTFIGNNSLVNFTIVVNNTNEIMANNMVIVDVLIEGFEFVNSTEDGFMEGNVLTWYVGSIENNTSRTFWVVVKAVKLGNWSNEVEVTYLENDTPSKSNTTVHVVPVNLTVNKTADVTGNISVNDNVTFIINITNNARANATDVNVTDIVPEGFEFVSSNATGYDNTTGKLTVPLIKAGESYVFTITLKAVTNGTLTNVVNVTCNENSTVKNSSAKVNVTPVVILTVEKRADTDDACIGDIITYTIVVTNNGPSNATNIRVIDCLDEGLDLVEGDLEQVIPFLESGKNTTITVKVRTTAKGTYWNTVNVTCDENSTVKTANASVHVYATDLKINKTVSETEFSVNDYINFTITVKNHGKSAATNINITDVLDSGFEFAGANATFTRTGNLITWNISGLASEATYTVWICVKALTNGTINNTAHVNCSEEPTLKNSTVTVNITPSVELTVNKTVNVAQISAGEEVIFTINVTNKGPSDATGVNISDKVPYGFEFVSSNATAYDNNTGLLTVPIIKAGESYVFTVTLKAVIDGNLTNTVKVNCSENPEVVTDTVKVNVTPVVNLSVEKIVSSDDAAIGDVLTYTIVVTNNGPSNATGIKVVDVLAEGLTLVEGDLEQTIPFLESGKNITITIKAKANVNGTLINYVNVSCSENDTIKSANASVHVYTPDLKINKTSAVTEVSVNDYINFTITVKNHGRANATNIHITDTLDSAFEFVNASGNFTRNGNTVIWYIPSLSNESVYTVWICVKALTNGTFNNTAHVNCSEEDTVKNSTSTVSVKPVVNLTVVKKADVKDINIGDEVTFTINVTNHGPSTATNIVVEDELPDSLTLISGEVKTIISSLESGKSYIITIKVKTTTTGDITNVVSVNCSENKTAVRSNDTVSVHNPKMNLTNTANDEYVYSGNQTSFTINITNVGDTVLTGIYLSDNIPKELIYDHFIGTNWTFDGEKFHYNGSLAVGDSVILIIVVNSTASGKFTTVATGGSDTTDECSDDASVRVYTPDIFIREISNNPLVIVGEPVSFTVVVTNTGDCDLNDITVVNQFPDGLIYTGFSGSSWSKLSVTDLLGYNNAGSWTKEGSVFSYSGTLKPGESISYILYFDTTRVGVFTPEVVVNSDLTSNATDNAYSNNTTVVIAPELEIVKDADKKSVKVGDLITFTITVKNTGGCRLSDIFVIDNAPSGLKYVKFTGSNWTKVDDKFIYNGTLEIGESISLDIVFKATVAGNFTNTAVAGSNMTGNVSGSCDFEVVNKTQPTPGPEPIPTPTPTPEPAPSPEHEKALKPVTMHATGNPIILLLLVIMAIIPLKRRKH